MVQGLSTFSPAILTVFSSQHKSRDEIKNFQFSEQHVGEIKDFHFPEQHVHCVGHHRIHTCMCCG